ncbi:hypothetical protein [Massilia sp. TS11]|uniref:hypothetical protein n=1 Tax=Massilia sp. TS11 TaxID=2908003 RepID=UPI001EDC332C|nr:hypothetical protein [Massilia sp. TS11]MCG2584522.1 hypothetical protein [Massilia sp. TS11]
MKLSTSTMLVASALALLASSAHAEDGNNITISGFGTAALTRTDNDQAEFARYNQAAGVKTQARTGVDSNFGIQATYKLNDSVSFTGQGLVRKFATDQYTGDLTWAFVRVKANADFSFRVGRIGTPLYMVSDFLDVGYANTMIRPSPEVYRQVPNNSFNGADLIYQHAYGDTNLTAQVGGGNVRVEVPGNEYYTFRPVKFVNLVAEHGAYTLRFGYASAPVSARNATSAETLVKTLRGLGLNSVADQLGLTDVHGSFSSLGLTADYGSVFIQSELAKRRTDSRLVQNTTSWYALIGYRYGKFTPYYYHGNVEQDSIRSFASLPTTGPLAPLTAATNAAIKSGLQSTNSLGLRWDFYKSAAFKVQMDRISPRDGAGGFVNATPAFKGSVNVYAAGIDFVF